MGYFAEIAEDGMVVQVISISNTVLNEPDVQFPDTEPYGQQFIADVLGFSGTWKQCSYNANFRACYPGPGYSYDPVLDVFVPPSAPEPPIEPVP